MLQLANTLLGKTAAFEADLIEAIGVCVASGGRHGKGQNVLRNGGASANVGVSADANKLVYRAKRADHGPFLDRHVSGDRGAVHQHRVIANHRVMSDVGVGHDQDVAANFRDPSTFDRAAVDGYALADFVVIADLQSRRLALVGNILRRHPNGAKGKENVLSSNLGWTFKCDVREQLAALPQFHLRADHAIGANFARGGNFGTRVNDGCGMNVSCARKTAIVCLGANHSAAASSALPPRPRELWTSWHDTVASATRLPSTE